MEEGRRTWKRLSTSRASVNAWFHYCHDQIELPDGSRTTYAYQDHADSVVVVPVTAQGQVVLLRQYRYPVDDWCYEVPAGGVHDEAPEDGARRELLEEAGGRCQELQQVGTFYGLPGSCNVRFVIFLATGVELGENTPEATEDLEVVCMDIEQALALVHSDGVSDGPSAVALLRCEPYLRRLLSKSTAGS